MSVRRAVVPMLLAAAACGALLAAPASADVDVLKRGSRGPVVVRLQERLRIPADGVFGPQTERAVRRFQSRRGLAVDGIVGSQTAEALGLNLAQGRSASGPAIRIPAALQRIAQCESGGDPRAVSPDGTYRGKYQFSRATWRDLGASGDPARASESEQDRRALALFRARGTAPWPSCAG